MDYESDCDKLSELPLSIIHIILALVPIKDAVRTSILSRQWRYTWTSLPWLRFEEECNNDKSRNKFEDRMENFITHVLVFHKGPIDKFKLSVPFRMNCRNIGVWLLCLAKNETKELIIDLQYSDSCGMQRLHSSIYYCKKLIKLELNRCELDPPPTTFKAFLFLRSLRLRETYMPTNEVEILVANCPLLENFTSTNCENPELRISAPNLKFLDLHDDFIEISVYAPLLVELSVFLEDYGHRFNHRHDSSVCNYTNFMGSFTNLEKLSGHHYFTKHLSMGIGPCNRILVFHRLKDIKLEEVNFGDIKAVKLVVLLVDGAPNLQKLEISVSGDGYTVNYDARNLDLLSREYYTDQEVPHVSNCDLRRLPNFKLGKLRTVHMNYVTDLPPLMAFIKFLLERSPVLETMIISIRYHLTEEQKQNVTDELLGFGRASPNANLVFLTSY